MKRARLCLVNDPSATLLTRLDALPRGSPAPRSARPSDELLREGRRPLFSTTAPFFRRAGRASGPVAFTQSSFITTIDRSLPFSPIPTRTGEHAGLTSENHAPRESSRATSPRESELIGVVESRSTPAQRRDDYRTFRHSLGRDRQTDRRFRDEERVDVELNDV